MNSTNIIISTISLDYKESKTIFADMISLKVKSDLNFFN